MIVHGDCIEFMKTLGDGEAQCVIADPPYNIGKDFGNDSDRQDMDTYLTWCDAWIAECLRILKPNGTMFIYGFSEILALISARVHTNKRWLVWHYTNKTVPSLNFWQRSHESILVLWKDSFVFNKDDVREPYTDAYKKAAGKTRAATPGRFSKGDKTSTYTVNENGALPRDVIKIPALAGGAGKNERVNHPTQKPIELCTRLIASCRQDTGYVLVPFVGSGSECVAASRMGLEYKGAELNPEYVALARQRVSQTQASSSE